MKQNNEIRFTATSELKDVVDNLHNKSFNDLKRTAFYQKVFLLGWNELLNQLIKQQPKEVLINLWKIQRK